MSGALSAPFALAADGGGVWVADSVEHGFHEHSLRVDRFDQETGAFTGPQLVEEPLAGATELAAGRALAVGHALSGEQVYVYATGGLAVYNGATGELSHVWSGHHTHAGSFGGEKGVAVDESASVDKGDVYVTSTSVLNPEVNVVDVFNPLTAKAAGEEPEAVLAELVGTCPFALGTACEPAEQKEHPFALPIEVAVSPVNGDVVVADYRVETNTTVLDVFEPSAVAGVYTFLFTITEANHSGFESRTRGLSVDGNGDIYLGQGGAVDQFNATGEYLTQLTGAPSAAFGAVESVGVDPATHRVFVGENSGLPVAVFGEGITIPDVNVTPASEVHAKHVTLNGGVKLDKAGSAECFFDYGPSKAYGKSAPCEPGTVTEAEEVPPGEAVPVKATVSGLEPDTTYFYRVRAVNSSGLPSDAGTEDEGTVKTSGPGLHGESSSEAASTAATLDATIDPDGSATSYYFQYNTTGTGPCEAHPEACTSIPVSPEAIGSAPGDLNLSQGVQGLQPATTYHYRVVVLSEPKPGEVETYPEPDQTLTTQPAGSGFALPDGRQWELVSPPDKHGALLSAIAEGWVIQSSLSGDAFTYLGSTPTEENARGYFDHEQILSTRGSSGWSSQDISLPHAIPAHASVGLGQDYAFFSEDLSVGLAEPHGEFTSLAPFAFPPDSERTPYVRHDLTCQATPSTCFQPLVTGAPGYADVPKGTSFGGTPDTETEPRVVFAGASSDLAHVVIRSKAALKEGAQPASLYEWSADEPFGEEELQPVSVLPEAEGGGVVSGDLGEERSTDARGAVSADGSRVFWRSPATGGLYLRDLTHGHSLVNGKEIPGEALRLDLPQGIAASGAPGPRFQVANRDGTRVFFTDSQQLLAGAGPGDLYECDITSTGQSPCSLRDVAPGADVVGGVLGASEDGSYVYFASNGVVGDGGARGAATGNCREDAGDEEPAASAGESCNLYLVHYDGASGSWEAPVFIAALSGNDGPDWNPLVAFQTARVSPDGEWLAFMSDRALTGYDNHDARHPEHVDEEVFLFNASQDRLVCASCNPTGARPMGREIPDEGTLVGGAKVWPGTWLAANIPSWTPYALEKARYQSRFLSDEGRLFFNSSDALAPSDVNNNEDVYQWEPAGLGTCSGSAPGFASAAGGCVGLISSGTSAQESAFLDASENGNDVFFLTGERLVPRDTDTALDVYDAHVCSSASPCFAPPGSPAPCATADACRTASPPQPEVFGAPASATFSGPGNQAPRPPASGAKPKTAEQVRLQRLAKALKACHKDKTRKTRAACEKAARKTYAKKASAKKPSIARRATTDRRATR